MSAADQCRAVDLLIYGNSLDDTHHLLFLRDLEGNMGGWSAQDVIVMHKAFVDNNGDKSREQAAKQGLSADGLAEFNSRNGLAFNSLKFFVEGMSLTYNVNRGGMTFAEADQEYRDRVQREALSGMALIFGIFTDAMMTGKRSMLPKDLADYGPKRIENLDDFISNPKQLKNATPNEWYNALKDNGYKPQPLSGGSLKDIPFENGGGFKVNWGGDKIIQYHPSGGHHGGVA